MTKNRSIGNSPLSQQSVDKFSNWGICGSCTMQAKTFQSRKVLKFLAFLILVVFFLFYQSSLFLELVDRLRFNYGSPKQLLTTLKKWIKIYQKKKEN